MARIGRCVGRGHGRPVAGLVLAGLVVLGAPAGPAAAHARLVGSAPEAGTTVERVPAEIVIELDAKPATIEGDPLQVYTPEGRRVDAGDPHVGEDGRRLAVTLDPGQPLPSGEYQVAYRVVSADSHVIAGRLSFTVRLPSPEWGAAGVDGLEAVGGTGLAGREAPAADDPGAGSRRLIAGRPYDPRPPLVAAGAVVLAALALLLGALRARWRRLVPRAAPTGDRSPSHHHRDQHRDRHRHGPGRRIASQHGRPPGRGTSGHRRPPSTGPPRDDEAFWAGPVARRSHRRAAAEHLGRAQASSGAPWGPAAEDRWWP